MEGNTMKNCSIPATALRAALTCASKGDVRFYLNGIYIEPNVGRIAATTGHVMFCGQIDRADFPSVIIPREVIEAAFKALGKKGIQRTNIEVIQEDGQFRMVTLDGTFPFTPIDGRFPDYDRIVPGKPSGKAAQFDPNLLMQVGEAMQWYSGQFARLSFHLSQNGEAAALYSEAGIKAFCVVMPMRAGEPGDLEWFSGKPRKAA
jgi:hypothetical protein